MEELFSCRNCIHNCAQSLSIGRGAGYCLKHDSVIPEPRRTTCKYLHRKDLPQFVVDEGLREHASEYALFPRLVRLDTKESIESVRYSERHAWETGSFDPTRHALAQYYKATPRWVFIQAFSGGVDGPRSLAYSSLVRHFLDQCGTWVSSYRLVLALIEDVAETPAFTESAFDDEGSGDDLSQEALWDVVFARIAAIQEYGWHAGIEQLLWATDSLNGSLSALDWPLLRRELSTCRDQWQTLIINEAKKHGEFFPAQPSEDAIDHAVQ